MSETTVQLIGLGIALLVLLLLAFLFSLWRASIQVGVYKRQGVEMSTWEVLMGAKPVERVIVAPPEKP